MMRLTNHGLRVINPLEFAWTETDFNFDDAIELADSSDQRVRRALDLIDQSDGLLANIERALRVSDRLSGHFVQGHVDACAPILALEPSGQDYSLDIALPPSIARYTILKGSITVDGMSLTIAALEADRFRIWITPHTFQITNLVTRKAGDLVNIEADMLAKYIEKLYANPGTANT